jgi:predicted ATPase
LLAELDRRLIEDSANRWVVVTGGPGMGKRALLAALLTQREAAGDRVPHHFIRRGEYDWDDPAKLVPLTERRWLQHATGRRAAAGNTWSRSCVHP